MKAKKVVAMGLLALLFGVGILIHYFNPSIIFQRNFGFSLPASSVIQNYKYDYYEGVFQAKISFEESDYQKVMEEIEAYSKRVHLHSILNSADLMPVCGHISWWDLNKENLIFAGLSMSRGKKVMTVFVYVFITDNEDGTYYLYTC